MKLSFIIPVYNVAPYLRKCVDSLLAQDYDDYEIILVDDGSTDGSGAICDEYVKSQITKTKLIAPLRQRNHKSQILKVLHQANAGLSAARNSGIEIAQGEYICFVDSDDYWQPNVLGGLMAQIERDNLDVLRFKHQFVNVGGVPFNPYKHDIYRNDNYSTEPTDGISFLNTRLGTGCYAWAFILRRDLIISEHISNRQSQITNRQCEKDILFTPGIYFEDTDWTPRMLVKAQRVASTNAIVYNYLMREGSITQAINRDKQKKVLDDKMRLIGALQAQAQTLREQGHSDAWFGRMIAATVVSIIGILSTQFYAERKEYLSRFYRMDIWPIYTGNHQSPITNLKTWLINLSPRLAVKLLHYKNRK